MKVCFGHCGATEWSLLVTLEPLWGHFGATLGAPWSHLGHMRMILASLGANLDSLEDHFGVIFSIWRDFRALSEPIRGDFGALSESIRHRKA